MSSRQRELRLEGVVRPVNGVAFAVDIGGSLAKLAYYAVHKRRTLSIKGDDDQRPTVPSSLLHGGEDAASTPGTTGDARGSSGGEARERSSDYETTNGIGDVDDDDSNDGDDSVHAAEVSALRVHEEDVEVGRLHLCYFHTSELEECIRFIEDKMESGDSCVVRTTGGGAHKYPALFEKSNLDVRRFDEMECLVRGCNYLLKSVQDEAFTFNKDRTPQRQFFHPSSEPFPYLLVNIGSGVSIIKVDSNHKFERVDGSALGGGTFWGLGSLLTGCHGFDDILELAQSGDCRNADMLVRDIYGQATPQSLGLDPDLTASCFGKARKSAAHRPPAHAAQMTQENHGPNDRASDTGVSKQASDDGEGGAEERGGERSSLHGRDTAASLLQMVAFNIAQISCLNARLYGIRNIFFAGFFIQNQPTTMHMITKAVQYWGREQLTALFLRHEGYVGAVGSFLGGMPKTHSGEHTRTHERKSSSASSASSRAARTPTLPEAVQEQYSIPAFKFGPLRETFNFEFEHNDPFVCFPLLPSPEAYKADTIDLMLDEQARSYWLECFRGNIDREYQRALACELEAEQRAEAFRRTFLTHMDILSSDPSVYGELSVRIILELRQQCLREFGFGDIYSDIKRLENETALQLLPRLLDELDELEFKHELRSALEGALAGNCFDWGAEAIARQLDAGTVHFHQQRSALRDKRWLRNDAEDFVRTFCSKQYSHAVIFVDNAGADIVLGMLPLARSLLKKKCRVTLAANAMPVLNDITFPELSALVQDVARMDPVVASALSAGTLAVLPNGTGSPCIDLKRVGRSLAQHVHDADLVILEGMGRAIHTNYDATLLCDTLKLAMIKNAWLAEKLGGQLFDVVCRFDAVSS